MTRYDALVVGAGAAGLMAARDLARAGRSVAILEARARPGGRIDTLHAPGLAAPIELGAEFIHGRPAVTLELMREAGLTYVEAGQQQAEISGGALAQPHEDRFDAVTSLFDAVDPKAPDESFESFLSRVAGEPSMAAVRRYARAMVEGFDAADTADVSVQSLREEWTGAASIDEGSYRPVEGYGALIEYLVRTLRDEGVDFYYDTVVERVTWNDGVRIDAGAQSFAAAHAVVTVPIGVLHAQKITFTPELPQQTIDAMHAIAMGPVVKIALQFDTRFWEHARGGSIAGVSFFQSFDTPFTTMWTPMPQRVPLMIAWAGGSQAMRFAGMDEGERREAALASLAAVFGLGISEVRGHLVRSCDPDWQADPYALGAYSYARVGAGDARKRLGEPFGPLQFAGEATADTAQAGTVAGALESGRRAAREIVRQMPCS